MTAKVRTTLFIDKDVVVKAKKLGLNLSVVCENSLIQAIEAMEGVYGKREPTEQSIS
ncbi:MAG: type II toxin-antitoxin system CcdA family antitoxin [Candidatus Bathyarchaeia archaeon]